MIDLTLIKNLFKFFHILGISVIFAGILPQLNLPQKHYSRLIYHGALLQLISGIILVALVEAINKDNINHIKITIKLILALVIFLLAIYTRKKGMTNKSFYTITSITVLETLIATMWR